MKISVCITCWQQDIHLAPRCLEHFRRQTRMPDEIVVSANGIAPWKHRDYQEQFRALVPCDLRLVSCWTRLPPAGARNRGIPQCRSDIVVFFDVDDLAHPEKIRLTEYVFSRFEADLFAHNYHPQGPLDVFDGQSAIDCDAVTFVTDVIVDPNPRSTNVLPIKHGPEGYYPMHQAHVAVRRCVLDRITFNESRSFFRREDGKFCQDVLRAGFKLVYADCKLVNYQ